MRVLVVHNRYRSGQPSGEDRVVDQEMGLLTRSGHEVGAYERRSDDIADFSSLGRLALPFRMAWSTRDQIAVSRRIRDFRPDVVHVHNTFPLISPSILRSCRRADVPVVMTVHNSRMVCAAGTFFRDGGNCFDCLHGGTLAAVRHRCYQGSLPRSIALASAISMHRRRRTWQRGVAVFIVMSAFYRDLLIGAHVLPAGQTTLKPHFVDRGDRARIGAGSHYLFLGRLDRAKGADLLLRAWDKSFGSLVVLGDGDDESRVRQLAETHGESVQFLGLQNHATAMELLREARALVVPSRSLETFGLTVPEAYARGVPVIAPRQGVFLETVRSGETGLHFTPGSAESLRQALTALRNDSLVERLGRAALQEYEDRYSPEVNLKQLEKTYRRAMAG